MATTQTPRRRRRFDPERRTRIARAAINIIARDGIDALTHRAVAKEADVPLGSTTYHFADKDELLNSAVELAQAADREMLAEALERFRPDRDLAAALAMLVEQLTVHDRERLIFDYELFLAARRRPMLTASARRWIEDTQALVGNYTDARTARVLVHVLEGILAQSVVLRESCAAADVEPDFRRILER